MSIRRFSYIKKRIITDNFMEKILWSEATEIKEVGGCFWRVRAPKVATKGPLEELLSRRLKRGFPISWRGIASDGLRVVDDGLMAPYARGPGHSGICLPTVA
jgi:hypothetical protein